LEISVVEPQ